MPRKISKRQKRINAWRKSVEKNLYKNGYWMLIEKVDGGFVVTTTPGGDYPQREVVAEPASSELIERGMDESEQEATLAVSIAYHIVDFFGLQGSKHNHFRFHAEVADQRVKKEDK